MNPGTNGTLPHSLEAEEHVLSVCMLDDGETVDRCQHAGLVPGAGGSMYLSAHGMVLAALYNLRSRNLPTNAATVAEELKARGQLDAVGGYAFITQVSGLTPTTAQAADFIRRVHDFAQRRAAVRLAEKIKEDCHDLTAPFDEVLASVKDGVEKLNANSAPTSALGEWADRRAGVGRILKPELPTLHLRGVPVFNRGNLGLLTALQKSGKTAAGGAILGAIIGGPGAAGDTLGFQANNEQGHAVIHLDTEQSPKDHEALVATAKKRAGAERTPAWLWSFGVKGVSAEQLRRTLPRLLREAKRAHGGVYAVLLDGVADFVNDPNDPKECNPFVKELEAIATDFDCSVLCVLHLNPAPAGQPTKSRGHLGSQLERKCETDLRLVKDADGVTTMFTACARHAPIFEKDGPRFSWDAKAEMHLSLAGTNQQAKDEAERDALRALAADCYADSPAPRMRYSALVSAVEKTANCKERTAQEKVKRMKKLGVIREVPPRLLEIVS